MNLPVRTRLGHEIPSWASDGSFYFITINCEPRKENQLCREGTGQAVMAAASHNHKELIWHCRLMLLMPDHLRTRLNGEPDLAESGSLQEKRILALKVFGSNLVLDSKKPRGSCVKPWLLLVENSSSFLVECLYNSARTFFQEQ
jgi:hypothetical protein